MAHAKEPRLPHPATLHLAVHRGVAGFIMLFGAVLWMHGSGPWMFLAGLIGVVT